MSKLDMQYKKVVYFSGCISLRPGLEGLLNNGQNPLSMMKVIYWVHSDDRLKHDRLLILNRLSE